MNVERSTVGTKKSRQPKRQKSLELVQSRQSLTTVGQEVVLYKSTIIDFATIIDICEYFALLKAFNTNTLNFHQYFKDKLSSHQPSHMHNTRHNK